MSDNSSNVNNNNNNNSINDINNNNVPKSHKRILTEQYEKKAHNYVQKYSVRQIDCNAKSDIMGNILAGNCPGPEMKPIMRIDKNRGMPSQELIKYNEKVNNLDNKGKYKNPNYLYSQDKINTFERVIVNDNKNKSYIYDQPLGKKNIAHQQSSMGSLLMHDNMPKGYEVQLNKPTQMKYSDILKSINENKANKLYTKPGNKINNLNGGNE
jgi:hypothetical protein